MTQRPLLHVLVLALAIGLFVGIERERRRKEAGLRTFAFTALLGAVGAMLGTPYALAALGLGGRTRVVTAEPEAYDGFPEVAVA